MATMAVAPTWPWPLPSVLNEEARELEALGVDVIQFDEPAFNVFMDDVKDWGIAALEAAAAGLKCTTAVHICYGYGIEANINWKETLGGEWRQYEEIFPALNASRIDQVSLECQGSKRAHVPDPALKDKTILVGAIDVATAKVETPEAVAAVLAEAAEIRRRRAHPGLHQLRHGAIVRARSPSTSSAPWGQAPGSSAISLVAEAPRSLLAGDFRRPGHVSRETGSLMQGRPTLAGPRDPSTLYFASEGR